jgi:cysteine synthase
MPIWLSISLIALVAGLGTGGTWYVMDQKIKKNDDKITTLQGQVDKLTKDAAKVTPTPTVIVTPTPTVAADATAKWKKYTYNK